MRVLRMLAGAIVVAAVLVPAVQTQDAADVRRLTILTFRAPVQLPGMTLPAGKYRFELADHNAPHIVRVLNEDGTKVIGTFPTIPTTRPTRDLRDTATLVMWAERPAGQPQAAKAWYYPQRSIGEAFVYPKAQALGIALANHTAVPSGDDGKEPFVYPTAQAPAIAAAKSATDWKRSSLAFESAFNTTVSRLSGTFGFTPLGAEGA